MMKKNIYWIAVVGVFFVGLVLMVHYVPANSANISGSDMSKAVTVIQLGDPKNSDLSGTNASVDRHPAGMNFYQHDWNPGALGIVKFENGKHEFVVDNVYSAIGMEDADVPGGISQWNINFGVSPDDAVTHEAALKKMMAFFASLREHGWKRYIEPDDPRLTGKQAWEYSKQQSLYSRDSTYIPTIEEWTNDVESRPRWKFYADGVYIEVSITESNMGGFVGKTTYLITALVRNEHDFYGVRYFYKNKEKVHNWKSLISDELKKYHESRVKTEEVLKSKGYTIDTAYQDPPIKALQGSASDSK